MPNADQEDWLSIGRTRDLSGPSLSTNDIDITSNDSPEHFKEFIAGLIDPGELTFDIVFDPAVATHIGTGESLLVYLKDRLTRHWRLLLPIQGSTPGIYRITPSSTAGERIIIPRDAPANAGSPDQDWNGANDTFFQFDGYVKDFGFETAMEDAIMGSIGVRITGNVFIV